VSHAQSKRRLPRCTADLSLRSAQDIDHCGADLGGAQATEHEHTGVLLLQSDVQVGAAGAATAG